jgi:uncharacterized protein (TIGR03382 family)
LPGELSIYSYTQTADGWLRIDLAGAAPRLFDAVRVWEEASLGGTLSVGLAEGFQPQAGDTFEILTAESLAGTSFDYWILPTIGEGLRWDIDYSSTDVTLRVLSVGDFDGNGQVDGADLDEWTAGFGLTGGSAHEQGDADGDGDVDGGDFLAWQRQSGSGIVSVAETYSAVPEPVAAWLAFAGAVLYMIRRRRWDRTP